jgi:hypothetical protein
LVLRYTIFVGPSCTGTAARFVQVEAMLDCLIDLQLQSNMPLICTPASG